MILRMRSLFLAYSALNLVKSFAYFFKVGKKNGNIQLPSNLDYVLAMQFYSGDLSPPGGQYLELQRSKSTQ